MNDGSVDPRTQLADWLRGGRARRRLGLDDVAKITKIQARILEKLEAGDHDGLPAEVFVRGFVKSFARCVGLDEAEALDKWAECKDAPAAPPAARALVQTMAAIAPVAARDVAPVPEVVVEVAPVEAPAAIVVATIEAEAVATAVKKKRAPRRKLAAGTTPPPNGEETPAPRPKRVRAPKRKVIELIAELPDGEPLAAPIEPAVEPTATWQPTMPALASTPSVPWRRPTLAQSSTAPAAIVPSLVIDDAAPELAEREQTRRADKAADQRVSFLPPILRDREDRSARQGGLTLAVIILLIAATLTLSYLMRRPSVTGDGVTVREVPGSLLA